MIRQIDEIKFLLGQGDFVFIAGMRGIDPKTNKVTKTIELNVPNAGGSIAYGEGWLWVSQTGFPITRIDAPNEKVVQQFWGDGGGLITAGSGAIWLSDVSGSKVARFDPSETVKSLFIAS